MSDLDLAWAAGFFDGEGTFARFGPTPGAVISQAGLECLDVFANCVGLGAVHGPYDKSTPTIRRKPQWTYYAYGPRAEALFWLLCPWLGPAKRAQGSRALQLGSCPDQIPFSDASLREQHAWASGFFDGEGCFSTCAQALNARITHTDARLLRQFLEVVGFGKVYGPYKPHRTSFGKKDQFVFTVSGLERVQALLAKLWPNLSSAKRLKAMALLEAHLTYWKCGHLRGTTWEPKCPRCSKKTGPKPRTKA